METLAIGSQDESIPGLSNAIKVILETTNKHPYGPVCFCFRRPTAETLWLQECEQFPIIWLHVETTAPNFCLDEIKR